MNYAQIIQGFLDLLQDSDNSETTAMPEWHQLDRTLDRLSDDEFDSIADALVDWCAAHQPLGENLRATALRWTPQKANPADEELIKKNISVIREKVKQKAEDQPPSEQKPENQQPTAQNP